MKSTTRFLKRLSCFTIAATLALSCLPACGGWQWGGLRGRGTGCPLLTW